MALPNKGRKASLAYHDIFDYPLTEAELEKWEAGLATIAKIKYKKVKINNNISQKKKRREISEKKLLIAKKAAGLIAKIPTIKMVAVTGALAMKNARAESDIDLLIITGAGVLWTTRLLTYCVLRIMNYAIRRPKEKQQKDRLCLNVWLDETALGWDRGDRNIYTAHEIAQIMPLMNKDFTYERFLAKNKWILDYWPKAIQYQKLNIKEQKSKPKNKNIYSLLFNFLSMIVERIAFKFQYLYMRKKVTREIITPHKALFHPNDWGKVVLDKLKRGL